jgi:hypothetical protein
LYQEHQVKPRQATNAIRLVIVWLSECLDFVIPLNEKTSLRDLKRMGNALQ